MIKLSVLVISAILALCLAVLFIAMKIANIKSEKETTLLAAFTSLLLMLLGCSFIVDGLIDLYFYIAK